MSRYLEAQIKQLDNNYYDVGNAYDNKNPAYPSSQGNKEILIGKTLKYDGVGRLEVNVTNNIEKGNVLPVSSSAVAIEIGNIDVLLSAI